MSFRLGFKGNDKLNSAKLYSRYSSLKSLRKEKYGCFLRNTPRTFTISLFYIQNHLCSEKSKSTNKDPSIFTKSSTKGAILLLLSKST